MELVTVSPRFRKGHQYTLNREAIKKLSGAEVSNMRVAVISVFGKGSGVIFDLLLKYANHRYKEGRSANDDWLADGIESGKRSVVNTSKSMMIWPEWFITKKDNENIAILLMGSQGILSFEEEACSFAINVLMSSCQLFHVNRRISEEQLKQIETFTRFARYLQDLEQHHKPFQLLSFAVRGWDYPTQFDFGFEGGQRYLIESVIHEARSAPDRLKTRHNVLSSFDEIKCFLMADIDVGVRSARPSVYENSNLFITHSRLFVQTVLSPDNLIFKRIGPEFVTVERLLQCLSDWVNALNRATIPDMNSMHRPSQQVNILFLRKAAIKLYTTKMVELGSDGPNYTDEQVLSSWHKEAMIAAMNYFEDKFEFDVSVSVAHKRTLKEAIDKEFAEIQAQNDMKFKPMKSLAWMPLMSAALIAISYYIFNNVQPLTPALSLTAFITFWLGATIFFRWCHIVYQLVLIFTANHAIEIVLWFGTLIYVGFRMYMYLYSRKTKTWYEW